LFFAPILGAMLGAFVGAFRCVRRYGRYGDVDRISHNKLVSVTVMEVLAGKGEMAETLFHFTKVPSDLVQMFNTHGL